MLVLAVAVERLVPHPFTFTPAGAFALFLGAYTNDKRFILLPLEALLIGDLLTGLYSIVVMIYVYLALAGAAGIRRLLLSSKRTPLRVITAPFCGATVFYFISNIGMWWIACSLNINGLVMCWIEGLPFLLRTMAGEFFYATVIFGIVELYERQRTIGYAS